MILYYEAAFLMVVRALKNLMTKVYYRIHKTSAQVLSL